MLNRRSFIRNVTGGAAALAGSSSPQARETFCNFQTGEKSAAPRIATHLQIDD